MTLSVRSHISRTTSPNHPVTILSAHVAPSPKNKDTVAYGQMNPIRLCCICCCSVGIFWLLFCWCCFGCCFGPLWWSRAALFISGFPDDVVLARNRPIRGYASGASTLTDSPGGSTGLGAESDVYDCLVTASACLLLSQKLKVPSC